MGHIWLPRSSVVVLGQGVSLFFVLSGFILHYTYRDRLRELGARRFIALRFFRLWPLHLAAIAFILVIFPFSLGWFRNNLSFGQVSAVVLMVQAWALDLGTVYAINAPSWSISTEMAFYASLPFLAPWIQRGPARTLTAIAAFTLLWLIGLQAVTSDPDVFHVLVGINPLPRVLEFAAGVALCEWMLRLAPSGRHSPLVWTAIECAAVVACALSMLASVPLTAMLRETVGGAFAQYVTVAGAFPAFTALIGVLYLQRGWVSVLLSQTVWVRLGEWSFAFYLFHQPAIRWWEQYVPHESVPIAGQVVLLFTAVTGVSALAHITIEKPCHALAKRRFDPRTRRVSADRWRVHGEPTRRTGVETSPRPES